MPKPPRLLVPLVLMLAQLFVAELVEADDPLVFRAQQKLTNLGYPTRPDGIYGRATRRAIREFQQDRGLRETGRRPARSKRWALASLHLLHLEVCGPAEQVLP